jgi:hypothetical protein
VSNLLRRRLVAQLLSGHRLSGGVADVEDPNLVFRDGKQRAVDTASTAVKELADFPLDRIVFGRQTAAFRRRGS